MNTESIKPYITKNRSFIIGISIPILMILFVAASIYLPALFIKPKYNFLYMDESSGYEKYDVKNNHLVRDVVNQDYEYLGDTYLNSDSGESNIYLYDVTKNSSRQITFAEAKQLKLNGSRLSSDGFRVTTGHSDSGGFFPFYSHNDDYESYYLVGNSVNKKINIQLNGHEYYSFYFLGWVE